MLKLREYLVNYPEKVYSWSRCHKILTNALIGLAFSLGFLYFTLKFSLGPRHKSTLVIGRTGSFLYLNPVIQTANTNELLLNSLLYDPLVEPNINGEILPSLAKTWSVSNDGKKYFFILRKDVFWHDNVRFSAEDVKATLELIKESKQNTALVKALDEVDINIISPSSIEFKLKQPNSTFLELLNIFIAKASSLRNYSYARLLEEPEIYNPIGTGPYFLKDKTLDSIELTANPKYFKGSPKIEEIKLKFFASEDELIANFIDRKVDLFLTKDPNVYSRFKDQKNYKVHTYNLAYYTRVIYFNLTKKGSPASNLNFRKALFYGIDKTELVKRLPGATISTGPYNEFSWAYLPKAKNPFNAKLAIKYLNACKKELKDKCTHLNLIYADTPENRIIVKNIQKQLSELGIDVKLSPLPAQDILEQILPNRDFDALYFGIQSTIDPDQYNLWHSSQVKYPGLNISGLSVKRIDYYLEQARITKDKLKRKKLYYSFQEELERHLPVIYLFNPPIYLITNKNIKVYSPQHFIISEQQLFRYIYKWEIGSN